MEKSLSVPGGMKSLSINFVNRQPLHGAFGWLSTGAALVSLIPLL
jgi:hypothetical protein